MFGEAFSCVLGGGAAVIVLAIAVAILVLLASIPIALLTARLREPKAPPQRSPAVASPDDELRSAFDASFERGGSYGARGR